MMIIYPAIDLLDGCCVRLSQGDYDRQSIYADDPLEMAKRFEATGISELHLVDLEGARQKSVVHLEVLKRIKDQTGLNVQFGGGIKSRTDAEKVLEAGADRMIVGSLAVQDPKEVSAWIDAFGSEKIVLGADLKSGKLAVNGWQESGDQDFDPFLKFYLERGIRRVLCTDVARDGMLAGPAIELYKSILEKFPETELLASGGVSNLDDLRELEEAGCFGAVVGKAIYEGKIKLEELSK
ncbi:MAG: 1-(5-phosphoribosyl)-5-[(5-phosphoribosylamino)methylideneamino]imidazole-4-carboxamide isomerase [Bacteroidetes bacterium]|nr:1-(5-phosphoribosyl)-5-[(5-phosphoribosylamino)methylideneamino]imidazole-4-carboxamide isomerase [Bacteroidota bacterium]